jgi:uncharacterized spore protein YtfJ
MPKTGHDAAARYRGLEVSIRGRATRRQNDPGAPKMMDNEQIANPADLPGAPNGVLGRIMSAVTDRAGSKLVYAEPTEHGGVTVIPVARVSYGFGGGSGTGKDGGGGGGGGCPGGLHRDPKQRIPLAADRLQVVPLVLAATIGAAIVLRAVRKIVRG